MTGLAAYHSTIVVSGAVSYFVLHEHAAVINFTYNSAKLKEGAIFVEKQLLVSSNTLITHFLDHL